MPIITAAWHKVVESALTGPLPVAKDWSLVDKAEAGMAVVNWLAKLAQVAPEVFRVIVALAFEVETPYSSSVETPLLLVTPTVPSDTLVILLTAFLNVPSALI